MKKIVILASGLFLSVNAYKGQEITLDKIYSGYYRGKGIAGISPLKTDDYYAVIEPTGIAKYSYKTLQKEGYIVEGRYEDYQLSNDGQKILLQKASEPIYRHSFLGIFDVKDLSRGKIVSLFEGKPVQEPAFSPDGSKVAFISENNLYYQDLASGQVVQITTDGKKNGILNGLADWVYEEEFGHAKQYVWNSGSNAIVFVRSDETAVPEMNMPIYGNNLYPQDFKFKYPKAGEKNSEVSLHYYQLATKKIAKVDLSAFENYYIPQLFVSKASDEVLVATANRHQNKLDILKLKTSNGKIEKLFTETDKAWIETDNLTLEFLSDGGMLWASERDGFRHLYWYDAKGKLKKQVTKGNWEITDYYGFDAKNQEVFVQTTQNGSINKVVSKININTGKSQIISDLEGNNTASFSPNFNYFINTTSSAKTPHKYVLRDRNGKSLKEIQNNDELLTKLKTDNWVEKEFFTVPNNAGDQMNTWIMKPKNFDPNKKYPLFMFQYSGPGSQQVSNSWDSGNGLWFNHLVQKGYIVACVDGRGTGYKGTKYKKSTYLNLGKFEIEDQITAAKWFGKQSYVDASRIGIFGWSFGGYMASLAMTKGADVFKMGIAVAPVTNWRFYDTVYTERFLRTPQENAKGYDENSPTEYAHLLKGKFLMIHGTADDNVHFQNAAVFSEALIQNKKQFEFMTYPDKNHSIYGGNTRSQLYEKMTQFILNNL
ncbi:S9 family peptidase [Riemerella anatipestifer]|uniref:S9 family peptidase n=1 Tax=Riemerella anatipestifer TaxID=34085 RepID=UPI0012B1D876|nr:S9 family peptidase [Riemerella anatipestifer]MBT0548618.1 S9 family peptidase [Riemerella anatipestifer]MBT0555494.1 S9 family peptidase [Riemerella anatipestifer]MBT0559381.1 S9 family peptidase [Riemerella anatipestifer]MCO7355674.1 S9 family peptidase [Riemerella anatipestifer]MDY3525865.1 S9 family peptidase [Riemerella anatipestifer]